MGFAIATATVDARKAIEARVKACWVTDCGQPATTIRWANAAIDPAANVTYLRVSVILGESIPVTYATTGGSDNKVGTIQLDLLGPKNIGEGALIALADKFKAKFQRIHDSGVRYRGVDGPREVFDSARARVILRVRVEYYEQL